ncbi:hypothetical protein SAMN06269185_2873 [Natronoarchaeum philippinense]|uniref:Uncharacterized protein n=1 Tax=Natronoarchaeum philippinense TaxID=558529 RepID=A0A285P5P6_NATPI|nr:hypothetical protein [Natronoarchaeum philippinense]SNZ17062.1 hypothetical protein SAMN06269185_2873 [Natronoarchaeum philippinense]
MLEYTRRAIASRFDHPIFALMYIIAVLLAASGATVQAMIRAGMSDWALGAGFFGVFAVFFALIGTICYALLFLVKGVSIARDRMGPAS